jgi:RecB family endonuclease NucS
MPIKVTKPGEIELSEKEIQEAFENNLEILEEGLKKIGSFISIGTGIIDTLAIDEEDNPVIIEFKNVGDFDRDALIQLITAFTCKI